MVEQSTALTEPQQEDVESLEGRSNGKYVLEACSFKKEIIKKVMITIKVVAISKWHDISIQATSTFGELKMILSLLTNLEPKEQRLLFKGKEREDNEYLHMVGVRDTDKVVMLEDPVIKERKLAGSPSSGSPYRTITV